MSFLFSLCDEVWVSSDVLSVEPNVLLFQDSDSQQIYGYRCLVGLLESFFKL